MKEGETVALRHISEIMEDVLAKLRSSAATQKELNGAGKERTPNTETDKTKTYDKPAKVGA
jgi:hypothetical protein